GDTDYLGLVSDEYFPNEAKGVQLGADRAMDVADWAIGELENRNALIHELVSSRMGYGPILKASDIYKNSVEQGEAPPIKPLFIVIDEFADIMLAQSKKAADTFMS